MATFVREAQYERKAAGYIIIDGVEVAATLQCCHCNAHFVSIRGSGKRRGYCYLCQQVTCGAPECDVCVPWERQMEILEREDRIRQRG